MKIFVGSLVLLAWSAAATAVPPCQVLTEADVRAALGGEWRVWEDLSGDEVCAFQGSPAAIISLTLASDPMGATRILELRRQAAGDKAMQATGPGEGAYRLAMPSANVIMFGKGDTVAQLEVSYAASKDATVVDKLAKAAYDRLP
jgi:hypothetical protein